MNNYRFFEIRNNERGSLCYIAVPQGIRNADNREPLVTKEQSDEVCSVFGIENPSDISKLTKREISKDEFLLAVPEFTEEVMARGEAV